MALKNAQPDTQLEVDRMILDYLLFEATQVVLEEAKIDRSERREAQADSDLALNLYHNFMPIFKCNHPDASAVPSQTRFRSRLLYFSTLFLRRYQRHPFALPPTELESIRYLHKRRAELWWDAAEQALPRHEAWASQLPTSPKDRQRALEQLKTNSKSASTRDSSIGQEDAASLLDLLPMFIALSAAVRQLQGPDVADVTEAWMHLAAEFMLQSVLEQWMIFESSGAEKIGEAFAWGWLAVPESEWPDEQIVNDMFCEEGLLQEVEKWADMRTRAIQLLRPQGHVRLAEHLDTLSKRFPLASFEKKISRFLRDLHLGMDEPLLTQVEMNRIKGLSIADMEALKKRARWPL